MNCKKILSALTAAIISSCICFTSAASAVNGTVYAESEDLIFHVNRENDSFFGTTDDGFIYDVWVYGEKETDRSGSATIRKDGSISVEWDIKKETLRGDFIFRYGLEYESGTDPLEQGEIKIDYDADYSSGELGNSQLGVYGCFDPKTEFYIIDDWVNWRPTKPNCKTVVIDDAEYDLLAFYETGGDLDADPERERRRYYSIRKQPRSSGTITVSEHFKAWAELGWCLEELRYVTFYVEGWKSEGSAEIKNLRFTAQHPVITDEQPRMIMGDFNFDSVIDSIDLTIAKATLIGGSDDDTTSEYMDLNCDHKFDAADVVLLKSFILGEIISFDKTADNEYESGAG